MAMEATAAAWSSNLKPSGSGQYYEGYIERKERLEDCLEGHRRATASTFGTQTSRRIDKSAEKENVSLAYCVMYKASYIL